MALSFSLNIITNNVGKKQLINVPKFSNITKENYLEFIDHDMNGVAIRMGSLINDDADEFVVLIDIDNKDDTNRVLYGMTKWNELIDGKKIYTPIQKTGNKITELLIDGLRYSIDFKGKNQFVIVEPSKYEKKVYKWKNEFSMNLQDMPN